MYRAATLNFKKYAHKLSADRLLFISWGRGVDFIKLQSIFILVGDLTLSPRRQLLELTSLAEMNEKSENNMRHYWYLYFKWLVFWKIINPVFY